MRKIKGQKLNLPDLKREIAKYLHKHPGSQFTARQLIKRLKIGNDKRSVEKALKALGKEGKVQTDGKTYSGNGKSAARPDTNNRKTYHGKVDMTRSGDAYIISDQFDQDVFVRSYDLDTAVNGDIVEFVLTGRRRGKLTGEVVGIEKRAVEHFMGTFYAFRKYGVVAPDTQGTDFDILVPKGQEGEAENGDKVVVRITRWPQGGKAPEGMVTVVIGEEGSSDLAMKRLLIENGFNIAFPEDVLAEARALPKEPSEKDLEDRRDFRGVTTFTIDPETAKDFDDALSVERLDSGNIEVGVHIADVTHYVREGTAIDKEAYLRSTSVYLVDRVAPMLPEELSNELCSLRPNEDSLCFSAVFQFDGNYKVVSRWFGKTIIHSNRRFAYEDAQEVIESGKGEFADEIKLLNELAHSLRKNKLKNGALTFETDEVQFVLDEDGVPVEVYTKERKEAHLLIEDFMLLANKEVARFIGEKRRLDNIPFVYRIHDQPDPDKIAELAMFAKMLGFEMRIDTPHQVAKSFNALAEAAQKDEALAVLEPLAIRTMAKAAYSTENIGHYGLAFTFYTHFTSPIRRYADVLVHRILFENIQGRTKRRDGGFLEDQCKHISDMERRAQRAERDSVKYKHAEFLKKHIGDTFDGHISGMIDRGIFVKLDGNHAEGMVSFGSLGEPFEMEGSRMSAVGRRSGRTLRLGDLVRVVIKGADPEKGQVDMRLVDTY